MLDGSRWVVNSEEYEAIRTGVKAEGFSDNEANAIKAKCYGTQSGGRVITLELCFNQSIALNEEVSAPSLIDQFVYAGRKFAIEFQLKAARLLPCIRIENKVILSVKDYENLRLAASRYIPDTPKDSDFGRQF